MIDVLDTVMNIVVFAFIGLLFWLYFKEFKPDDSQSRDSEM
jgi:hypothetical protein